MRFRAPTAWRTTPWQRAGRWRSTKGSTHPRGPQRRSPSGRQAGGPGRAPMDSRILGMGRGGRGIRLDRRRLADARAGHDLGGRPLDARRFRLVSRPRILEPAPRCSGHAQRDDRCSAATLRAAGPPADPPASDVAPAPGPDYFFIAGHFEPAGDQLDWKPGFWAKVQPGWDWIPARWVRLSTGWEFRAGNWTRDTDATDLRVAVGRSTGRRIARRPALPPRELSSPDPEFDRPPQPPLDRDQRDPIAEAEENPGLLVLPRELVPYYVIRAPGSYPYGPGGVLVPGVVPPFVRRLLDRVLP